LYVDTVLNMKHIQAIKRVEGIQKEMGWRPGYRPRTFKFFKYLELTEAEADAERAGAAVVAYAQKVDDEVRLRRNAS
jgi:hypothetical protein